MHAFEEAAEPQQSDRPDKVTAAPTNSRNAVSRAAQAGRSTAHSFDHLAAHEELGERDARNEAEHCEDQGGLEVNWASRADADRQRQEHGAHIHGVQAEHPVLRARSADHPVCVARHRGDEHGLSGHDGPQENVAASFEDLHKQCFVAVLDFATHSSSSTRSRT